MKHTIQNYLLNLLIICLTLSLSFCTSSSNKFGPTTMAGIIIDETGNLKTPPQNSGNVLLSATGQTSVQLPIANDAYVQKDVSKINAPYLISASYTVGTGAHFYSYGDANDVATDTVDLIFNTNNGNNPVLQILLLNHDQSVMSQNITVTLTDQTQNKTYNQSNSPNGTVFSSVNFFDTNTIITGHNYKFSFQYSKKGQQFTVNRSFTAPPTVSNETIGYTFYLD